MAARLLSAERQAELLARYPSEGNSELAKDFGLTPAQVAHIAWENDVRKTRATRSALSTRNRGRGPSVLQRALAVATAAGKAGISRAELITAMPGENVGKALDSLGGRGYLHAAGPRGRTRWFAELADAQAHAASSSTALRVSNNLRAVKRRKRNAGITVSEPAARQAAAPAAPPHAPPPRVDGLFTHLGPGQYVDDTPRSWVAAITRRA